MNAWNCSIPGIIEDFATVCLRHRRNVVNLNETYPKVCQVSALPRYSTPPPARLWTRPGWCHSHCSHCLKFCKQSNTERGRSQDGDNNVLLIVFCHSQHRDPLNMIRQRRNISNQSIHWRDHIRKLLLWKSSWFNTTAKSNLSSLKCVPNTSSPFYEKNFYNIGF